jgi:integrase/recombinase XerD
MSKRVLTSKGLRYCPVVISKNGRIKPDAVLVDGKEETHPDNDASARRFAKEAELNAINRGNGPTILAPQSRDGKVSLNAAVAAYLEEIKLTKKPKTYARIQHGFGVFPRVLPQVTCL